MSFFLPFAISSVLLLSGATSACTMLELSLGPLNRVYNIPRAQHRFHYDGFTLNEYKTSGFTLNEGTIGRLVDPNLYRGNADAIAKECPSLVKLRVVYNPANSAQRITTEDWRIRQYLSQGWVEGNPAGYCSSSRACGATKNLRGVYAHDGGNNVFTTDSYELNILNTQNARYRGTISPTICWLF